MKLIKTDLKKAKSEGYNVYEGTDIYNINVSGNNIGIVSVDKSNHGLYLEYIEVDKEFREYGYAREALARIMRLYKVERLSGNSTVEAYPVWKALGAEIEIDNEDELTVYDEIGECIPFILELKKTLGGN